MTLQHYLQDTLSQLIDEALALKKDGTDEFGKGKLFGYYEVISKLLNQAEAFGIANQLPSKLRGFNPEILLPND